MQKADEVAILSNFVRSLPANSYLQDFFQGSVPFFESAVKSDLVFAHADNLRSMQHEVTAYESRIKDAAMRLAEIEAKAAAAELRCRRAESEIESLRREAKAFARTLRDKIADVESI